MYRYFITIPPVTQLPTSPIAAGGRFEIDLGWDKNFPTIEKTLDESGCTYDTKLNDTPCLYCTSKNKDVFDLLFGIYSDAALNVNNLKGVCYEFGIEVEKCCNKGIVEVWKPHVCFKFQNGDFTVVKDTDGCIKRTQPIKINSIEIDSLKTKIAKAGAEKINFYDCATNGFVDVSFYCGEIEEQLTSTFGIVDDDYVFGINFGPVPSGPGWTIVKHSEVITPTNGTDPSEDDPEDLELEYQGNTTYVRECKPETQPIGTWIQDGNNWYRAVPVVLTQTGQTQCWSYPEQNQNINQSISFGDFLQCIFPCKDAEFKSAFFGINSAGLQVPNNKAYQNAIELYKNKAVFQVNDIFVGGNVTATQPYMVCWNDWFKELQCKFQNKLCIYKDENGCYRLEHCSINENVQVLGLKGKFDFEDTEIQYKENTGKGVYNFKGLGAIMPDTFTLAFQDCKIKDQENGTSVECNLQTNLSELLRKKFETFTDSNGNTQVREVYVYENNNSVIESLGMVCLDVDANGNAFVSQGANPKNGEVSFNFGLSNLGILLLINCDKQPYCNGTITDDAGNSFDCEFDSESLIEIPENIINKLIECCQYSKFAKEDKVLIFDTGTIAEGGCGLIKLVNFTLLNNCLTAGEACVLTNEESELLLANRFGNNLIKIG